MEQKAVTYKTVRGMARDMAMSSGNNDFSYENYNIRITTRGKEDSLVVTNEKGTESNIIATRDVLKTVNNVFVGMQPDFYNNYYAISGEGFDYTDSYDYTELYKPVTQQDPTPNDGYRQITKEEFDAKHKIEYNEDSTITSENFDAYKAYLYIAGTEVGTYIKVKDTDVFDEEQTYYRQSVILDPTIIFYKKSVVNEITPLVVGNTDNGIIKFALNTEYPTDSDLVVKSVFKIKESPITYDGEQYTLLNDGEFINENQLITINAGSNYGYDTESIKDIVLNGATDNGAKGDEEIDDKLWLDSYKRLYKKITDTNFTFSGFNAMMNYIDYIDSSTLSLIPISSVSKNVVLPTGLFKEGDTYEDGTVSQPQTTSGDFKKVVATVPQLGYYTGLVFSKNYPNNAQLNIQKFENYIYIPAFKKVIPGTDTFDPTYIYNDKIYFDITPNNGIVTGSIYPKTGVNDNSSSPNYFGNFYKLVGYIKVNIDFDIELPLGNNSSRSAYQLSVIGFNGGTISSSDISVSSATALFDYDFLSSSNPNSACFSLNIQDVTTSENYCYYNPGGPFFKENVNRTSTDTSVVKPNILIGNSITIYDVRDTEITLSVSGSYFHCNGDNISSATDGINNGYSFEDNSKSVVKRTISSEIVKYNVNSYVLSKTEINSKVAISSVKTTKDSNNVYFTELTLPYTTLIYNKLDNVVNISGSTDKYFIYKITIDNIPVPYIIYTKSDLRDLTTESNPVDVYYFNGTAFSEISYASNPTMLPSDLTSAKVNLKIGTGKIIKTNNGYKFGDVYSGSTITSAGDNIKSLDRLDYLPIYETNDVIYSAVTDSNFDTYKNNGYIFYEKTGSNPDTYEVADPQPTTYSSGYYIIKATDVDSLAKVLYENPNYNTVVEHFEFKINNFKSSIDVQSFKLKRSNNNWDNKFIYNFLLQNSDFVDYTRKLIPMSVLDTYTLSDLNIKYENGYTEFSVNLISPDYKYFNDASDIRLQSIDVTICDLKNKGYTKQCTIYELMSGVKDTTLCNQDASKHAFKIKDIREHDLPAETDLIVDDTKNIVQFEDKYTGNETVTLQMLKYQDQRFIREIIDFGVYKFTSTVEYDFVTDYKINFFSIINNSILVSNFGEYHALTIPGRVLGSCTIDDYVVLFFHYSSPALNYYRYDSTNDIYIICPPNSIDLTNPDYYELYTRNTRMGFDLAAKDGSLLKDDNNDYINGKNEDYIIKLKYIDARPDNDENEWAEIVTKISNVSTQSSLNTDVTMKKPYYSADILYHGNLGFNANNGIETIGYYESKDVIKVYFTDGKNQPRMIDIMTPLSQRNGTHKRWDAKSFDFIQEINGKEEYDIVKKFGGGAFPAGTVQYYFTYTNLGGCETNPFICSPIYYTSQSDTGNSPLKITDNTFKIKLTNLSTRFDYVNIYSVVRTTKDMQTLCKRVINISLNGKTEVEFTDNNLLGEIVDSNYLLMLQGTPISALTMAEKDNTLFLGNINKLQKALTIEDKEKLKNCFEVKDGLREYQNYNPNEDNWYENKVKDKIKLDYYGNEVKDANGDNIIDSKISLEGNSSEIKTFMYNEYYRLGIQLQDKFGKWSDPIFIEDVKCEKTIETSLTETEDKEDKHTYVDNIISKIPYFYLEVIDKDELSNIISNYEFVRIRPVIVYPNISSRNVLCQGLLNPTMFNYSDRSMNAPYNFASYFFRPMPPAISYNKDDSGNSLHNPSLDIQKVCGYPIEYRHGFPISGYHDAIEEGLAESENTSNVDDNTVKALVDNYLLNVNVDAVKLTSNTIGWWVNASVYLREGNIILLDDKHVIYKSGSKIYEVNSKKNKGDIKLLQSLTSDRIDSDYGHGNNLIEPSLTANKFFGNFLTGTSGSAMSAYSKCRGFKSHMHYFKNALAYFAMISWDNVFDIVGGNDVAGNEVIKGVGSTDCILGETGILFNEGNVYYKATYPVEIKFIPKTDIKLKKHRGLKRKTYFVDIVVKPATVAGNTGSISVYTSTGTDGYIDDPGFTGDNSAVTKKAYFASNDGEIQCANGNKAYNFFAEKLKDKLDNTYNSSEISSASRQQSLFYIDESICTLNSPEIEYDPTVQKIDLSTYKLNIIGAANITGYAQNVRIDTETPPATAGTTVCEGFKHDNIEVQNFNKEAYRYMLSGGYWYDNVFYEGDDETPEKKYDSADLISDQYCWWVYPFNRQILNNSKEGANGKLRTKQWYNYHYSAFNDYFGKSSIDYELKDAQQIYGDFQSTNFDSDWTTRKCLYFGSVDTAYTNPVPLVGILGGSNEPEENAYEQSLAISPHTKFKDKDSYSAATYADIVPLSFRSTNHFLLSFKGNYGNNRLLPEYYSDINLLQSNNSDIVKFETKEYYKIITCDDTDLSAGNYFIKELNYTSSNIEIYKLDENGLGTTPVGSLRNYGVGFTKYFIINILDDEYTYNKLVYYNKLEDKLVLEPAFFKNEQVVESNIEYLNENYVGIRSYTDQIDKIIINNQVTGCERPYVQCDNEKAGIYKYGHIYIAQLERGVKSADEVFSGTEESVLLQNTWIPAGVAINIDDAIGGKEIQYTEGDTFYQRYDCLKTYGYNEASVNQVIESLSTMIQTRINLDGIYSLRGNVDNLGTNETNTNLLNTAYSQSDNYFTYSITDPYISQITEYSNMFTWSLTKQPMSRNDNWLAINLIAYYNATGSFGKITRIINYRNNLFCFQDNAISQIAYNERVALTPSDGVPIEIGNSGKVQGLNYISSNVGCQNRWSVCPSKGYLYWVDDRRAEIYRFGEGLEPFSTVNGFSDWVKANTYGEDWKPIKSTNVPITTYYDNNNDDIYFVTEKDCLAYNEKLNAFESFFSYEDSFILNSAGNTIVIKEQDALVKDMLDYTDLYNESDTSWWSNGIRGDGLSSIELMHEGEYNKFFGEYKPYYLRFKVYPTDLQRDKIYTNLEFNLDAFDEKDIYMPDDTFTRVRVWNEYQWGEMNFDNIYGTTSYKKRFRTWYLQLPRASYYPTGLYENYDYLYQRQLEWNYITSDILADKTLAYYSYWNENSNCVNDRIRNPWIWLELYKNPKASLNFELYDFADAEVKNCTQAYYNEHKLDLFEIISGKFVRQEESSSYDGNKKYYNCIDDYLEKKNYLYYKVYVQVSSDDYDKYDILYSSTAEDAQPYTDDRTNPSLILYRLNYRNCANILTFDTEKVYYKLNISNNRMEIHDIILKYFEA